MSHDVLPIRFGAVDARAGQDDPPWRRGTVINKITADHLARWAFVYIRQSRYKCLRHEPNCLARLPKQKRRQ